MEKFIEENSFIYIFTYNNRVSAKLANFQILPNGGWDFSPPIWGF